MNERMRRWRESVARGEADNERASIRRAALRPPGKNVEAALELSAFVMSYAADLRRGGEVAPIARWREIQRRREYPSTPD